MTEKLKCPFCGKPIRYLGTDLFTCDACHIMLPAKHWVAYINTRKAQDALNYAIGVLENLTEIGGVDMQIIKIKEMAGIK